MSETCRLTRNMLLLLVSMCRVNGPWSVLMLHRLPNNPQPKIKNEKKNKDGKYSKRGMLVVTYNAFLDDFSTTGDGIACMENNRIRVVANGAA